MSSSVEKSTTLIYGTVTNQVTDLCGIYKKIVAGNRGGLQDIYFR